MIKSLAQMMLVIGLLMGLAGTSASSASPRGTMDAPALPSVPTLSSKHAVLAAYGRSALQFEANQGQTDPQVKFLARGLGYTVFLTASEAVLVLPPARVDEQPGSPPGRALKRSRLPRQVTSTRSDSNATVVRVSLVGAQPEPAVAGLERLPAKVNYIIGNDPGKWRTDIPTYAKVQYREVYPGVDVVYYGVQGRVEYDFVVAPGADPTRIRLAVTGPDMLDVDAAGDLVLHTREGSLRMHKPLIYQEVAGARKQVAGGYVRLGPRQIGIRVAAYDAARPLVIDPVLSYSTYLGGSGDDHGTGIAVDIAGNAYVTGRTSSPNFPTVNALQGALGGAAGFEDAFVTKLDATGSPVYSTYLGGGGVDRGLGIAVDSLGNAYVTGSTTSNDFPLQNAFQTVFGGFYDAFVAKLGPTGSLVYSTYLYSPTLGGSQTEVGSGIAVDNSGNAYVTGATSAENPGQVACGRSGLFLESDAFVAKLNASGSSLAYWTCLGGTGDDGGLGIAVDISGNAYVTGSTASNDFPLLNASQLSFGGDADAFVAKLDAAGSPVYSTYLGGSGVDGGLGIAVDALGNAYVTGETTSAHFPTTANALQPLFAGSGTNVYDAFVTKLDANGVLAYSTYLGGSGDDHGTGIAVDIAGNAYVTGRTTSSDFPVFDALQLTPGGGTDAFVAKLDATGSSLVYSTYLGASGNDEGVGIAVDTAGNAYVTGITTSSTNFATPNAYWPTYHGGGDAFVAKIGVAPLATLQSITVVIDGVPPDPLVGQTRQLHATGHYSDGSTSDLTGVATWSPSSAVVTIASGGLATAEHAGTADITAAYNGITSSPVILNVGPANTQIVLSGSPNPSYVGELVTFDATVSTNPASAVVPTGGTVTVTIKRNNRVNTLSSPLVAGHALVSTSTLVDVASYQVTATYTPPASPADFNGSATPTAWAQQVTKWETSTALGFAQARTQVTLTATIIPDRGPAPVLPGGKVTFYEGSKKLSTQNVKGGSAIFTTTKLGPGQHDITAVYGGDQTFAASTKTLTIIVQ